MRMRYLLVPAIILLSALYAGAQQTCEEQLQNLSNACQATANELIEQRKLVAALKEQTEAQAVLLETQKLLTANAEARVVLTEGQRDNWKLMFESQLAIDKAKDQVIAAGEEAIRQLKKKAGKAGLITRMIAGAAGGAAIGAAGGPLGAAAGAVVGGIIGAVK